MADKKFVAALAKIADTLDSKGHTEDADKIDAILESLQVKPETSQVAQVKSETSQVAKEEENESESKDGVVAEILENLHVATEGYLQKVTLARSALYRQLAADYNPDTDNVLRAICDASEAIQAVCSSPRLSKQANDE